MERPGRDDHNAAAVRASLRVFLATSASLKAWAVIKERFFKAKPEYALQFPSKLCFDRQLTCSRKEDNTMALTHPPTLPFPIIHSSPSSPPLSFSHAFALIFLPKESYPFRKRNPRTSRTLTSRFAPAVGASLAGFMLGVYPWRKLRLTIAIYILSQAAK